MWGLNGRDGGGRLIPAGPDAKAQRGLFPGEELVLREICGLSVSIEDLGPPAAIVVAEKVPGPELIFANILAVKETEGKLVCCTYSLAAASRRWLFINSSR